MIVYDITNPTSFQNTSKWLKELKDHVNEDCLILLVGNKCDLEDQREVSKEQGQNMAEKLNMNFFECSAANKTNVDQAFTWLLNELHGRKKKMQTQPSVQQTMTPPTPTPTSPKPSENTINLHDNQQQQQQQQSSQQSTPPPKKGFCSIL